MTSHDPVIGVHIGRYAIKSKLAEGGMGAVYVAEHLWLENTRKVVKILLAEHSQNEVIRRRFEREATAVSRLKHKHIITIDDFGQLPDGQLFLMMPFLEGKPLDVHIRQNGKLSEHHTLHIMVQICRALQHAHDHGIVHRDLKPGNIFITPTDDNPYEVTLIDLGIARDVAADTRALHTQTGIAMGTPGYMAVEQYGNASSASPAADLYSAAIVAWEMVTGCLPWGVHDPRVLYYRQMTERPVPPPELSAAWAQILLGALSVRPEGRPPSMRSLAVALASATPAMPPHVPSGADILLRFAKEFVQNAPPTIETVRHASATDLLTPQLWPRRATQLAVPPAREARPADAMPETVNERPNAARSTAVPRVRHIPPVARWKLALASVGGFVLAATATFALAQLRARPRAEASITNSVQPAPHVKTLAPPERVVLDAVNRWIAEMNARQR
jgi:serine/threonine protein kinase